MKKYYSCFIVALFLFLMSFSAYAAEEINFDFNQNAGGWITNLSDISFENGAWNGKTNAGNNIILYSPPAKKIYGKDYPVLALRVRYTNSVNSHVPNTYAYVEMKDDNGTVITNGLYSSEVKHNITATAADNGKWVTYYFPFYQYDLYNDGYISRIAIGIGNGVTGLDVSMDWLSFLTQSEAEVSFADASGDASVVLPEKQTVGFGSEFLLTSYKATRNGYYFCGWSTTSDGNNVIKSISAVTENTTLYAVWSKNEHVQVTLEANAPIGEVSGLAGGQKKAGSFLSDLKQPERVGYQFVGWGKTADTDVPLADFALTADITLFALWKPDYTWDFEDDTIGDWVTNQSGYLIQNGVFQATSATNDQWMRISGLHLSTGLYNTLELSIGQTLPEGVTSRVQVYVSLDGGGYSEANSVSVNLGTTGDEFTKLTFDLSKVSDFASAKEITAIRLDPCSAANVDYRIDYLKLPMTDAPVALFQPDGGTGSMSGIRADDTGAVIMPKCEFTHPSKIFGGWTADGSKVYKAGEKAVLSGRTVFKPIWTDGKAGVVDAEYYPGFVKKALILSYDDGSIKHDTALLEKLNAAGLKASFNLIAGNLNDAQKPLIKNLYQGHEVANHTYTHSTMYAHTDDGGFKFTEEYCFEDIQKGKDLLEELTGQKVEGFAWPYTACLDRPNVLKYVRDRYLYARGSSRGTFNFEIPEDFQEDWSFTCFHVDGALNKYMELYKEYSEEDLSLYSIWGHPAEFPSSVSWDELDQFIASYQEMKDTLWNPTVIDYVKYINAKRSLMKNDEFIFNPSDLPLYLTTNNQQLVLQPQELYNGEKVIPTAAKRDGNKIQVTVNTALNTEEEVQVIFAAHDADKRLVACRIQTKAPYENVLSAQAELEIPETTKNADVSVYLLSSEKELMSLAPAIRLEAAE